MSKFDVRYQTRQREPRVSFVSPPRGIHSGDGLPEWNKCAIIITEMEGFVKGSGHWPRITNNAEGEGGFRSYNWQEVTPLA